MESEVLIVILSIVSTIMTSLIGGITYLFRDRSRQRDRKHEVEDRIDLLKAECYKEREQILAVKHLIDNTKETNPPEMLKAIKEIVAD
jgi:hypothetical protein